MTHSIGNTVGVEGTTIPTEVVEDYSLVEQDDSTRPAVYASGDLYTSLSTTRETDFDFNFFDFFLPVNGGPPPHYHPFEHEIWHVTDGEFQFNLGDRGELGIVVPEGTTVFGPIDRTHGYRNLDSTASLIGVTPGARTLSMTTPGALDLFFDFSALSVVDRDAPIPTFDGPQPEDFINLAKFSARTNAGITLLALDPDYQPPEDALDYLLVLPENAKGKVVKEAKKLNRINGFSVWTTGEQKGLLQRPTFTGDFDIEYTSLTSLEESGDKFAYDRFELAPETTEDFPDPVTSEDHQLFYVDEGNLAVEIDGKVEVAEKNTYVHIAPENEYAIANFSDEPVEALSISIPTVDEPDLTQELFPSPVTPLGNIPTNRQVVLGDEADFYSKSDLSRCRIFAGGGDDEIYVNKEDVVSAEAGDDFIFASEGLGRNRLYGNQGNDIILASTSDRVFGGDGDDYLNGAIGSGRSGAEVSSRNYLNGGNGKDYLIAGNDSELHGSNGDDTLQIRDGGGNLLYGGAGSDDFWLANGQLPDAVAVKYPEKIDALLPKGLSLPELADTRNTIMDFELGVDKIYISGIEDVSFFEDLQLLPAFGDFGSTSIAAEFTENGANKDISLATVTGVIFNEFSAEDFVFV
ncbi:cupin domain-containing protein [Myxosarcina sp. GI1]|uniref:cupin domain-containing protein n=1 Tax=Myxosarcina sp. GI1 TaxID=1541065 RepID=UPI0005617138|nr:cupin domain-containing protein [Myxosarcina sp. GI1]